MSDLPPMPEPNKRKMVFVGGIVAVCAIILVVILVMANVGKKDTGKGFNPKMKEVDVWAVNLPTTMFDALNTGFNAYVDRKDMKIRARIFGTYEDFLDVFLLSVQKGQFPDVIVLPNHGGHLLLDPYIAGLGENIISMKNFEDNFHQLFVDELTFEERTKEGDANKIITGLRGIPMGFEPLGMYYNRKLLPVSPKYWDTIPDELSDAAKEEGIPAFNLGYGRATPVSADIWPFLTMQIKGRAFDSYKSLGVIESRAVLEQILNYRTGSNNLDQYASDYARTLTTTDLFVRGKIATLVGYPSTEKEIALAIARAKKDEVYDSNFEQDLRWTTIPQVTEDPKKQSNFARYGYFTLVNNSPHRDKDKPSQDAVIKFMQYLATPAAQKTLFENNEYYLPSQLTLLKDSLDTEIDAKSGKLNMKVRDWYDPNQVFYTYDKGIPHLYNTIVTRALDEPNASATTMAENAAKYMQCKIDHLSDPDTYPFACGCVVDVQINNNHYWPVCERGI